MGTRRLAVLCLVIMVGLAGCSGILPFGESATQPRADTQNETDPSDIPYPDGYNESGITDPEKAVDQHEKILFDHDNFTVDIDYSDEGAGATVAANTVESVNMTDKRLHRTHSATGGNVFGVNEEIYINNTTTYEMNETSFNETQYNVSQQQFPYPEAGYDVLPTLFTNASFDDPTLITYENASTIRYNVTDVESAEPFIIPNSTKDPTVDTFNGTLLVDTDGFIRSFTYTMTYTTDEGKQTARSGYRFTALNETTVEKPDWVETARWQTI